MPPRSRAAKMPLFDEFDQIIKNAVEDAKAKIESSRPVAAQETARQAQPFRFFDLPAELRAAILEYAATQPEPLDVSTITPLPPVTRASRQLRAEPLPLYFSKNTLAIAIRTGAFAMDNHSLSIRHHPAPPYLPGLIPNLGLKERMRLGAVQPQSVRLFQKLETYVEARSIPGQPLSQYPRDGHLIHAPLWRFSVCANQASQGSVVVRVERLDQRIQDR